jgi:hypothetical protein
MCLHIRPQTRRMEMAKSKKRSSAKVTRDGDALDLRPDAEMNQPLARADSVA